MSESVKAHIPELDHVIAFDLETTGLDEQKDQILEVAAVAGSFKDGVFVETQRLQQVLPLQSNIEDWHEAVLEMHTKNGLLAEAVTLRKRLLQQPSGAVGRFYADVDLALRRLTSAGPIDAKWTLLGNSVHFDLRFARRVFPEFAKRLSHRVFDVSAVRLFCEMLGKPYVKGEVAHRAMPDVESSLGLLAHYRDFARGLPSYFQPAPVVSSTPPMVGV